MVATILKKVTAKGIEAATQSVSSSSTSMTTTTCTPVNSNIAGSSSSSSTAAPIAPIAIATNTNKNSKKSTLGQNQDIELHANLITIENVGSDSDDSYFGKWTDMATDTYTSAKETIYSASDEASKKILNLSSLVYTHAPKSADLSGRARIELNATIEQQPATNTSTSAQRSNETLTLTSPRKWFMKDPYNTVTGRSNLLPTHHRNSVNAVRNLLELVHVDSSDESSVSIWDGKSMQAIDTQTSNGSESFGSDAFINLVDEESNEGGSIDQNIMTGLVDIGGSSSGGAGAGGSRPKRNRQISKAVTASRLGEGTIRAMRDMALNEALELHHALRFWTERLERPILYYLEGGPMLWASQDDDHHAVIGQKVSQLQAVLARRCSSIGELQQHLWRAGWQSGVEQWGILGQGEWAAVVGDHGAIEDSHQTHVSFDDQSSSKDRKRSFFASMRRDGKSSPKSTKNGKRDTDYYTESHLFVKNVRGGQIVTNDSALAAWSIDAIRVVRDQLYGAGSGLTPLPYFQNWPREQRHFGKRRQRGDEVSNPRLGDSMMSADVKNVFRDEDDEGALDIPLWATNDVEHDVEHGNVSIYKDPTNDLSLSGVKEADQTEEFLPSLAEQQQRGDVIISDLSLMAAEVTEILNSMEKYMHLQRTRRLDKLKPPPRFIRNWYVAAVGIPVAGYVTYNLMKGNAGARLATEVYQKIVSFCAEHVSEPLQSM